MNNYRVSCAARLSGALGVLSERIVVDVTAEDEAGARLAAIDAVYAHHGEKYEHVKPSQVAKV